MSVHKCLLNSALMACAFIIGKQSYYYIVKARCKIFSGGSATKDICTDNKHVTLTLLYISEFVYVLGLGVLF